MPVPDPLPGLVDSAVYIYGARLVRAHARRMATGVPDDVWVSVLLYLDAVRELQLIKSPRPRRPPPVPPQDAPCALAGAVELIARAFDPK